MQQKIEAFGPPTYIPLERRFGRTSEDAPWRMIRRVDNQKVTGVKGSGGFQTVSAWSGILRMKYYS